MKRWIIYLTEKEMDDIKKGEIISKYLPEGVIDMEIWKPDNPYNHAPDKIRGLDKPERGQALGCDSGSESGLS